MSTMAIITPSYSPDVENFSRLHASVLEHTDESVMHHVIVPGIDADLFRDTGGLRLTVWTHGSVMPEGLVATERLAVATRKVPQWPSSVNVAAVERRQPWRPVRGWILQQLLKMVMARHVNADLLVSIDSDVVLVRRMAAESFLEGGAVRLYADEGAITKAMERHYEWCRVAHEMLGLPWEALTSYPDFIAGLVSWDPLLLRRCQDRVEHVTGRPWAVAASRNLHFSEDILYGTFVQHFGTELERSNQRDTPRCHSYWSPTPMRSSEAEAFVAAFSDDHLAVHIQSNSRTHGGIENAVLDQLKGKALS